ncbi:MAG: hypothetical protein HOY71_27275 [Nonomuraea sp.]|nr:hypothetical protein [Nonomuraea sp.]
MRTLGGVPADRWQAPAGELEWTCWETMEHLADDLISYALRFGLAEPLRAPRIPIRITQDREAGPDNIVFADAAAGPEGLLTAVEACGGVLATVVDATAPATLAPHVYGASDPSGFAAMGVVETLIHTYDVTSGLGLPFEPPAELCALSLARLFRDVPAIEAPWPDLLWAAGRIELRGRARRTDWRWYGAP